MSAFPALLPFSGYGLGLRRANGGGTAALDRLLQRNQKSGA
jgi:hypothetical protein